MLHCEQQGVRIVNAPRMRMDPPHVNRLLPSIAISSYEPQGIQVLFGYFL